MRHHARDIAFDLCNTVFQTDSSVSEAAIKVLQIVESCMNFERGAIILDGNGTRAPRVLAHSLGTSSSDEFCADMTQVGKLLARNSPNSVVRSVLAEGEPLIIDDVTQSQIYVAADDTMMSEACVPLIARGRTFGALNFESREVDAFCRSDITLLSTVATQLGLILSHGFATGELDEGSDWRSVHNLEGAAVAL